MNLDYSVYEVARDCQGILGSSWDTLAYKLGLLCTEVARGAEASQDHPISWPVNLDYSVLK